jgi:hypothetical protein
MRSVDGSSVARHIREQAELILDHVDSGSTPDYDFIRLHAMQLFQIAMSAVPPQVEESNCIYLNLSA